MGHGTALSFTLGSIAFIGTHIGVVLQLLHILNDPFNFGMNTIDEKHEPSASCDAFNVDNAKFDALLFLIWTVQHSGMARPEVKKMLGLYEKPIERGVYGILSVASYAAILLFWKPVTNCTSFDLFNAIENEPLMVGLGAATVAVGTVFVLSILYMLVSSKSYAW